MIDGMATRADVADLLRTKDYEIAQLDAAQKAFAPKWAGSDPAAAAQWSNDYRAFLLRYAAAKAAAQKTLASTSLGVPDDFTPDPSDYRAILLALQKTPGVTSPGDFQDLWSRLTTAQDAPIFEDIAIVQPTATDWDLSVYKAADSGVKAVQGAAAALTPSTGTSLLLVAALAALAVIAVRR